MVRQALSGGRADSPLRTRLQGTPQLTFVTANHQLMGHWSATKSDLVHAHEAKAVHWAWLHHCLRGTPYILTRRVPQEVKATGFNRRCYRQASMAVAISSPIEQHLQARHWCPVQRIPSALAHLKHDPANVATLRSHYAGAFVFLMRAAGIPARVVSGYQGGEFNPLDGYLVIRQSDAHAWAEVWLEGQGWVRVDPTASVSPTRIETGIADALPFGEPLPALVQWRADWLRTLRYRWEAVNNAWNQHILGYDPQRQRELLSRLGLPETDWRSLATVLGIACSLLVAAMTAWTLYQRPAIDPARRLWLTALRQLARRQVDCAPWETPMAVAQRVREQRPELAETFQNVVDAYLQARYGKSNNNLNALREAVARLRE